jgi:hypothetical protein
MATAAPGPPGAFLFPGRYFGNRPPHAGSNIAVGAFGTTGQQLSILPTAASAGTEALLFSGTDGC